MVAKKGKAAVGGKKSNTQGAAKRSAKVTPTLYFDSVAPGILKAHGKGGKGTCVIRLTGGDGGVWTIDLNRTEVRRGGVNKPDFYMEMAEEDFASVLEAKLDVKEAFSAGRIRFEGDPDMLTHMSAVLRPPQV